VDDVSTWADLLKDSPYIALILGLAIVSAYLFRSRDKLQAKYTEDLVKAAQALQELTAEYLKQSFSDSASWQDRFKGIETQLTQHVAEMSAFNKRTEDKIEDLRVAIKELADTFRSSLRESEGRMRDDLIRGLEQNLMKVEAALDRLGRE
jgi:uncharacterized membrane-anchored protein YhcB (DUF1043 family)